MNTSAPSPALASQAPSFSRRRIGECGRMGGFRGKTGHGVIPSPFVPFDNFTRLPCTAVRSARVCGR